MTTTSTPTRGAPARVITTRAAALVAALVLLAVPSWTTSTAQAAEPVPAPITTRALNQTTSDFPLSGLSSCVKTDPMTLSGRYTYGQNFAGIVTYDHIGMTVPTGVYRMHDCARDNHEFGSRERVSWLDPAPDPRDHTSGVIVTLDPLTGPDQIPAHGPTVWGSWILADTTT